MSLAGSRFSPDSAPRAGPLSQWLFSALAEAHLYFPNDLAWVLKNLANKTDRNDARGIAQMMRAGLYRPVHVKTTMQMLVSLTETSSPAKWSMLRFSF
jgi:transposase